MTNNLMTNKEAIRILQDELKHTEFHLKDKDKSDEFYEEMKSYCEVYKLAIRALKREECKDVQAVCRSCSLCFTPIKTVTNAEEAEAYPIIDQEENCRILRDFLRDITGIDIRNLIKESDKDD